MIRQIADIQFYSLDVDNIEWKKMPMYPATGKIEYTEEDGVVEYNLSCVLTNSFKEIRHNLVVRIVFDNNQSITLGKRENPVRFKIQTEPNITVSVKYMSAK